jgi:uncharacterized protein YdeI (YjbR/CyaY-like superfamily)
VPEHSDKGVEIPDELVIALANAPRAHERFEALAPSHQREWANFVDDATEPDARRRRASRCVDDLLGR